MPTCADAPVCACVSVCVCVCTLVYLRAGEVTPVNNPGEGKKKAQKIKPTNEQQYFFFPMKKYDMMASNRSMHTNSKCQKCVCVSESVLLSLCVCVRAYFVSFFPPMTLGNETLPPKLLSLFCPVVVSE